MNQYNGMQQSETVSSTKNGKITNIMSDYEKTKTFNQELLRNIGSPKGPIFARVSNPYTSYNENEV